MLQHQINKVSAVVVETSFIARSSSNPESSILKRSKSVKEASRDIETNSCSQALAPSSHRREPSSNDAPQSCQQS